MKLMVDFPQFFVCHMRVDLRGADAFVAQHLLQDTQINSLIQKICGKAVAHYMGR